MVRAFKIKMSNIAKIKFNCLNKEIILFFFYSTTVSDPVSYKKYTIY